MWRRILGDICEKDFRCPATAYGVAVDDAGAVIVAGAAEPWNNIGHLDLGQGPVNPQRESGFVAKFAPDGQTRWSHGIAFSEVYAIAARGDTVGMIGEARCGSERPAPFVMAVDDSTGSERWARWMPAAGHGGLVGGRVTVAADGSIAFTGREDAGVVVASIGRSGVPAWTRTLYPAGPSNPEPPRPIVAMPLGLALVPVRDHGGRSSERVLGLVR